MSTLQRKRARTASGDLVYPDGTPLDEMSPVTVGLHAVDPAVEPMPGDDSALDSNGQDVILQSLGALYFEVRDDKDQELVLAPGGVADVDIPAAGPVPPPDKVPLWSFDMTTGRWIEATTPPVPPVVPPGGFPIVWHGTLPGTGFANADLAWTDAACVRIVVDGAALPANALPVCLVMSVQWNGSLQRRGQCVNAGTTSVYSLPSNSSLSFATSPGYNLPPSGSPTVTINTGAPWGGNGVPRSHALCNAQLLIPPLP